MRFITLLLVLILGFSAVHAQILVEDPEDNQGSDRTSSQSTEVKTGEGAARRYFSERQTSKKSSSSGFSSPSDRYMTVHFGGFLSDKQYRWGSQDRDEDVGELIGGVSYRVGEWVNSMDLLFRAELSSYDIDGDTPTKLSLMPIIVFPDAASEFPLYFGAGVGLGIFFSQIGDESDLSLDYQLISGLRFPRLFNDTTGFLFEIGYKGHVHLFSSGQFNGTYAAAGAVFQF